MTRREAITNAAALAGIGLSIPLLSVSLTACKQEPKDQLDVLSPEQAVLLQSISATLLPKGTTIGAEDVEINKVIDVLLRDCTSVEDVAELSLLLNHLSTEMATSDGMTSLLQKVESNVYSTAETISELKGYTRLKSMILFAFFTSEPVMESMLDYNPIPTRYDGCTDVTPDTKVYVDLNV